MCLNTEGSFVCVCPPSRDDTNGREGEGCVGEIINSFLLWLYLHCVNRSGPHKLACMATLSRLFCLFGKG